MSNKVQLHLSLLLSSKEGLVKAGGLLLISMPLIRLLTD